MKNRIYLGNLNFASTEEDIKSLLSSYADLVNIDLIKDVRTGRSRGFAFVEFGSGESAAKVISDLDSKDFQGRPLKVNAATDKKADDAPKGRGRYDRERS